ncbi:hypothetical protein GX563_10170 [Candidatus Bathyarchaeota archaeon]|nr:hypothetical protein [Candidatus Bathyarchaeota archaeon]
MSRKPLIIVVIVGFAIGLFAAYTLLNLPPNQTSQNQTPTPAPASTQTMTSNPTLFDQRVFCSVDKYQSSNSWVGSSPVIAHYYPDGDYQPSYLPPPQTAYLYLRITNNNTQPLYGVIAEVRYQSSGGSWKTVQSEIGFIEVNGLRTANLTLSNPAIIVSNSTMINMHDANHRFVNVINYVLGPHEQDAYGYDRER